MVCEALQLEHSLHMKYNKKRYDMCQYREYFLINDDDIKDIKNECSKHILKENPYDKEKIKPKVIQCVNCLKCFAQHQKEN